MKDLRTENPITLMKETETVQRRGKQLCVRTENDTAHVYASQSDKSQRKSPSKCQWHSFLKIRQIRKIHANTQKSLNSQSILGKNTTWKAPHNSRATLMRKIRIAA